MGKRKVRIRKLPVSSAEMKQKIAFYVTNFGSGKFADMILQDKFMPNIEKWYNFFEKIEKRKIDRVKRQKAKNIPPVHNTKKIPSEHFEIKKNMAQILQNTKFKDAEYTISAHYYQIRDFIQNKWKDIVSNKRTFGLEEEKIYDIQISDNCLKLFMLRSLRFHQKGLKPPAVGVDFVADKNNSFPCALDTEGKLIVHKVLKEIFSNEYQILLNLAAVSYFYDLVIPKTIERSSCNRKSKSEKRHQPHHPSRGPLIKAIPRKKSNGKRLNEKSEATNNNQPSYVDPFRRRLPHGQKPTFEKIVEADQYGINLKGPGHPNVQYTFVKGHVRGVLDKKQILEYSHKQDYKAVKTFETIINILGFS
jgi:hypothetical protein